MELILKYCFYSALDACLRGSAKMRLDFELVTKITKDLLEQSYNFAENDFIKNKVSIQYLKNLLVVQEQIARCLGLSFYLNDFFLYF